MIRAVIDTNVLVSAMISPSGNEALRFLAVSHGLVTPCFSREILEEYTGVLSRPKFGFPAHEIRALLGLLLDRGELQDAASMRRVSPDPGDDKFVACALTAKADFVVTGNRRHFPPNALRPAKVVSAGELLDLITRGL